MSLTVWITRTDSSAAASAQAVEAAGFTPLVAPLLKLTVASTPDRVPPSDHALAFTSRNGVRAFASLTDRRHWPVFTVGDATAQMARNYGFKSVRSAGADVAALGRLIISEQAGRPSFHGVTHMSGVHVAGDLVGDLKAKGLTAHREIIYAADAISDLPPNVTSALNINKPLAVMLYSPKAAHILLRHLPEHFNAPLHCVSLSETIDAVLGERNFASRIIAAAPNETALIEALETLGARA